MLTRHKACIHSFQDARTSHLPLPLAASLEAPPGCAGGASRPPSMPPVFRAAKENGRRLSQCERVNLSWCGLPAQASGPGFPLGAQETDILPAT